MTRRTIYAGLALGLLLYLVFLVAFAPAAWVAVALARFAPGPVTLATPQGTVWNGEADLYAGQGAKQHLGRLRWGVQPLRLFLARVALRLDVAGPAEGHLRLERGLSQVAVSDLTATLPAHLLGAFYPPAQFFAPTGSVELKADNLALSSRAVTGAAQAVWRGAGGRFTGPESIGDYRLDVAGQGERATLQVSTLAGALEVNGRGQWQPAGDGELQFSGSATPQAGNAQLEAVLRLLGPDRGGGRRDLRLQTRVPLARALGLGG